MIVDAVGERSLYRIGCFWCELRLVATGVDVVVRYVTRASERFVLRNKINVALLGLMEGTERPAE